MLGLKRDTVCLSPHDPKWDHAFEHARRELVEPLCFCGCRIEHVGSTAVPGLPAKPILDIAIGLVAGSEFEPVSAAIVRTGYFYRGDVGADGGHLFVRESAPEFRTHHVHVVYMGDPQWENYLTFRNLLRRDPDAAARYADAKLRLAATAGDRKSYTAGKAAIIKELLASAGAA